jgi:hypothetical protein
MRFGFFQAKKAENGHIDSSSLSSPLFLCNGSFLHAGARTLAAAQQENNHQQDNNMLRPRSVHAAAAADDDDAEDAKRNQDRPVYHGTTKGHDCTANIFYLAIAFCCDARYMLYLMVVCIVLSTSFVVCTFVCLSVKRFVRPSLPIVVRS